jgi:hypothetical protein
MLQIGLREFMRVERSESIGLSLANDMFTRINHCMSLPSFMTPFLGKSRTSPRCIAIQPYYYTSKSLKQSRYLD